ncbi:MAG: hypothetical protein GX824_09870 [Clostridiales bacterium]|nr:hypothetical protein [Clostridiales bacterium]
MNSCFDCGNLDKKRKLVNGAFYNYACNARSGHTCGSVRCDKDLKWQGCSEWIEIHKLKQLSIFDMMQ